MSDTAPHLAELEARFEADLSALREQAKTAGDRIVSGVDELRVLTPPPVAPSASDAPDELARESATAPDLTGELDAIDDPLLDDPVATDDDGIPIWSDP